ncbi:hypothetical protein ECANGB1_159 [Enterospora canceri]|uniref:Uncharacterized protein n=1 Tax=Enterospora canceri TaxID=1081671 RepID=A0A1Y1S5B2_9MICR|nr:hypothetical protein ECANGB1_159 [Enterospora canceri]
MPSSAASSVGNAHSSVVSAYAALEKVKHASAVNANQVNAILNECKDCKQVKDVLVYKDGDVYRDYTNNIEFTMTDGQLKDKSGAFAGKDCGCKKSEIPEKGKLTETGLIQDNAVPESECQQQKNLMDKMAAQSASPTQSAVGGGAQSASGGAGGAPTQSTGAAQSVAPTQSAAGGASGGSSPAQSAAPAQSQPAPAQSAAPSQSQAATPTPAQSAAPTQSQAPAPVQSAAPAPVQSQAPAPTPSPTEPSQPTSHTCSDNTTKPEQECTNINVTDNKEQTIPLNTEGRNGIQFRALKLKYDLKCSDDKKKETKAVKTDRGGMDACSHKEPAVTTRNCSSMQPVSTTKCTSTTSKCSSSSAAVPVASTKEITKEVTKEVPVTRTVQNTVTNIVQNTVTDTVSSTETVCSVQTQTKSVTEVKTVSVEKKEEKKCEQKKEEKKCEKPAPEKCQDKDKVSKEDQDQSEDTSYITINKTVVVETTDSEDQGIECKPDCECEEKNTCQNPCETLKCEIVQGNSEKEKKQ